MENTSQHQFETREYQVELIERIKQTNAILFLPTGSGKTYIALEIIKYMQNDLQKPVSFGGKRTIFLVNTVALAEQHYSFLEKHTSFRIKMLTGESGADQMDAEKWSIIEDDCQIFLMTSQVYFNALTHADLRLKNANLIIFDECHHAVNNHPMREVMKFFKNCDEKHHPKVLGLTATLINGNTNLQNFTEELAVLQETFRSKIITSSRVAEVKKFSTKAKEIRQQTVPYESPTDITNKIKDWIRNYITVLEDMKLTSGKFSKAKWKSMNDRSEKRKKLLKNCLNDLMVHLEEYGLYFCYKGCECYITQLNKIILDKSHEKDYCNAVLQLRTLLLLIRKLLADEFFRPELRESTDVIARNSAEKLRYLLVQLRNFSPTDKCIIFVERRITANILSKIIRIFFEEIKSEIVVDFMIGSSPHPLRNFKEEANDRKRNKEVMANFRSGKTNILVASNVLEEGIDMPDCNAVFMYDFPKTYRSYVQSKGRARDENSSYVIFIDQDVENCSKLEHFHELEKKLEEVVPLFDISSILEHELPSRRDKYEETYTTAKEAAIKQAQAIPIINKYCSTLPHDKFTQSDPDYRCSEESGGYSCQLRLPTNAAIRQIKGPVRPTKREAKEAVAFKAVKKLHQMNALDDGLKPVLAAFKKEDEEYWLPHWPKVDAAGDDIKSAKKEILEKEEVPIKVPIYLEKSRPTANKTCYLHVINIEAKYPIPETHRRQKCHELLTSRNELGIITKNKLPEVCDFPVFCDLGEVRIRINTNHHSFKLSNDELFAVSRFHRVLFLNAIQIVNKFLLYSEESDNHQGYFVVPLKPSTYRNGMEINFEVVFNQYEIFDVEKHSVKEQVQDYNDYQDCVVFPYHLMNHDKEADGRKKFYVVTDVHKNETLQSPFPNKYYASYAEYYEKRHKLKCQNPNQPLLEARQIPHKLNFLRPRGKAEKQENENNQVAEFCMKIKFPGVYWYKSTCLPTILHRLHYLLLAEELRERIASEGIGVLEWNKGDSDVLEVYGKYDCRKSLNTKQDAGLKNGSNGKTETSRTIGRRFSQAPPLMTLKKHTNYEGPSQKDIFEAITPRECNDILDLERLETLGDSFLKFAVSFTVFVKTTEKNEGYLTQLKGKLVGNQNLFYCGNNFNLGSYINVNTFSAVSNWCPPGFVLPPMLKEIRSITDGSVIFHTDIPTSEQFSGIISSKTLARMKENVKKFMSEKSLKSKSEDEKHALLFFEKQSVVRKTIADVIEALVGAYVKTGGIKPAFQLLNYFGIIDKPTYEDVMGTRRRPPVFEKSELTNQDFNKLEKLLNYKFRNRAYIVQALSHPSNIKNTDYQMLEFVGDAVLDFLITSFIFEYCGDFLPPGKVTDLRASLVNNITFGALSVKLGFHKFLLSDNERLTNSINDFENYQKQRNFRIDENDMMVVISNGSDKIAREVEVPKVLGDIFESLAGAIFLDSDHNFDEVWRVYYNIMKDLIETFSRKIPINPVRALYEEPNLKTNFSRNDKNGNVASKKSGDGMMTMKLTFERNKKKVEYYGVGENTDLCKRAAAKFALRDFFKRTESFI